MTNTAPARLQEIAAAWRTARRAYPIYAAVIARFSLPIEPCRHLESPIDRNDPEAVEQISHWLEKADTAVEASQLRIVLQSQAVGAEAGMRALLQRYLAKPDAATTYRDKIDFLAAQYFTHVAPLSMARGRVRNDEVARVLEPVIGPTPANTPAWIDELDLLITKLDSCESLRDLVSERLLEDGRDFKVRKGADFIKPMELVAFTRYNFLVRRAFIRLLHNDLENIPKILDELQKRNVTTLDCRQAGLGESASLDEIRHYCRNWKSIFRTNFNERDVCNAVVRILEICEKKLEETPVAASAPTPVAEPVSVAAAPPEITVETPMPVPLAAPELRFTVEQAIASIANQLLADDRHQAKLATGTVRLAESKSVLSSWEVAAFLKGSDSVARALQVAVAARAVVDEALDRKKRNEPVDLACIVKLGHAEAARLQEQIAQARDTRNIDAAVNLAATQKRLLQILDQAEKLQSGGAS